MVDEEEYLRPFVVLDELLATLICSIRIMRKMELYSTPRMVYEGFNGIINFHNIFISKDFNKIKFD